MNPDPDEHIHPGEEDLEWGKGIKEKHRVDKPQTKYWAVGEQARKMISHESLCKMFCGGKSCKYCKSDNWSKEQMAVDGLYSEWVTCNILAMARMSNENIDKFDMIKQLQNLQVKTVINLQQAGEHAHCGSGNDVSGFSYRPQRLMDAGLFFYNFTIQDYGVTGMSTLLDIVKVMQFAVSLGKVAVHCHAGLGRTGLVIACYLIYNNRVKTCKAIQYVRSRRPGAIQTKQQILACQQFEEYLEPFFVVFSKSHSISFNHFLTRQRHLLHGYEARKLKYIPKVVYICCERLLELCGAGNSLSSLRSTPDTTDLDALSDILTSGEPSPSGQLNFLEPEGSPSESLKNSSSNDKLVSLISSSSQPGVLSSAEEKPNTNSFPNGVETLHDNTGCSDSAPVCSDDDDDCIIYGHTFQEFPQSSKLVEELGIAEKSEDAERENDDNKSVSSVNRSSEMLSADDIWTMITQGNYPDSALIRIAELKENLNLTEKGWQDLAREGNPLVICGILCDWLDQLNEPVLRTQDVSVLIENVTDSGRALLRLEKSSKCFLEYIMLVVSKFDITSLRLRQEALEFFLSYLCQKRLNIILSYTSSRQSHFGDLKQDSAVGLFKLCLSLLEQETQVAKL